MRVVCCVLSNTQHATRNTQHTPKGSPLTTHPYIPNTAEDQAEMLARIGVPEVADLFQEIPEAARRPALNLPPALSEPELVAHLRALAARNRDVEALSSFL